MRSHTARCVKGFGMLPNKQTADFLRGENLLFLPLGTERHCLLIR